MSGKTAVVTGASRGLGYVTAFTLAKKGAEVILLNRKSAKGDGVFGSQHPKIFLKTAVF